MNATIANPDAQAAFSAPLGSVNFVNYPISLALDNLKRAQRRPGNVECEDCGDSCQRRTLCFHCGMMVCPWCWHHVHQCLPGHRKEECRDWLRYKKHGRQWIDRLRARGKLENAHSQNAEVSGQPPSATPAETKKL